MTDQGKIYRFSTLLEIILKFLVTSTMLCIAVITFIDVIGRYFFSAPIPGAFEIQEIGMGIVIFSGLPLVTKSRGHITIGLFDGLLERSSAAYRIKMVLVNFASGGILYFITYCLFRQAINMEKWNTSSAFLELPYYPFVWFMTVMTAIAATIFVGFALLAINGELDEKSNGEGSNIL